MKQFLILFFLSTTFFAQAQEEINWMTFEEAIEATKTAPKPIFIDVYTSWCGWCKKMDKTTFVDKEMVAYMSTHFYAVKLDAEQRETITYKDNDFNFVETDSIRHKGVHTLAYSLLDGKLSYPSFVILNKKEQRMGIEKGFKDAPTFISILKGYVSKDS